MQFAADCVEDGRCKTCSERLLWAALKPSEGLWGGWTSFSHDQDPKMMATEAALSHYLNLAVERDWPRMAQGKESHEVTEALDAVYVAALRLTEGETRQ